MIELFRDVLLLIGRAINFVLDILLTVSRMRRLAQWFTGSDAIVDVPPEPRILPPAAQRALAESEQRRRDGASFIDKYVSLASR
jgi:hypothetical protein